jgi:NDP-sugar pyrophosphorylase family protein
MKAMILAAGLGTRLRPLTDKKPKVLMPVVNKPVIGWVIEYLKKLGISSIVVNAHHHYQQIIDYLDRGRPFGMEIDVRVEPEILGTGGGIKNTEDFWDSEPFIVVNGDILTDIDLNRAYEAHKKSGGLATLILHDCEPYNQVQIENNRVIKDITTDSGPGKLAFTGIHLIEPELLSSIPGGEFSDIIDCYLRLIHSGKIIHSHLTTGHYWRDIGTVNNYIKANRELLGKESCSIGADCHIDSSVKIEEWAVVGEKSSLEKDVEIRRSILWDEVRVKKGTKVIDSIVTSSKTVDRDLIGKVY